MSGRVVLSDPGSVGRLRSPAATCALAVVVRAGVALILIEIVGARSVGLALRSLEPSWIAVVAGAELLTYPAYTTAYRSVARLGGHARIPLRFSAQVVLAGFGTFALRGGFGIDRQALSAIDGDERDARVRVAALATLELAVLAATACVVSIVVLAEGAGYPGSVTWPWAIGVPLGAATAAWVLASRRIERMTRSHGLRAAMFGETLQGARALRELAGHPRRHLGAWLGIGLYWSAEVLALYGALRAVGIRAGAVTTLLAYAAGYAASRRSLPLGGAGLVEVLLTLSLVWLHEPASRAVAVVILYRAFNFAMIALPALLAYRTLRRTMPPIGRSPWE